MRSYRSGLALAAVVLAGACGGTDTHPEVEAGVSPPAGTWMVIESVEVPAAIQASGIAEPVAESTLSTKLMATVLTVRVREGDRVRSGEVLVELDARDLDAKAAQADAARAAARAALDEAELHAVRIRALFLEEAAPRATLDAAESALARAQAGLDAAEAAAAELSAVRDYSVIRAPFDGIIVRRSVDPGAFAAPGTPLLTIQDVRRLRVAATASPSSLRDLSRGDDVATTIEGVPARATIEGIVPAGGGLYTVNALVDNADGRHLAGSAAALALPAGMHTAVFVPADAIQRQGDLTGVWVESGGGVTLRWIRLGEPADETVEVLAGLRSGDRVLVPSTIAEAS